MRRHRAVVRVSARDLLVARSRADRLGVGWSCLRVARSVGGVGGEAWGSGRRASPCDNSGMTRAELHELVDRLPDEAVDGAAVLLAEVTAGRIDADQAWFWTREWQTREREADTDRDAGRGTSYASDEELLAALDARTKPLDADA